MKCSYSVLPADNTAFGCCKTKSANCALYFLFVDYTNLRKFNVYVLFKARVGVHYQI